MITIETKIGDVVTNQYGERGTVIGTTEKGTFWRIRNIRSGRVVMARRITADTVIITATIEGDN